MNAPDIALLRQLAVRVLMQAAGPAPDAASVAAATRRSTDALARVLAPLIGRVGIDALAARALHLAQREYPWLAKTGDAEEADGALIHVSVCLAHQEPALAIQAAAAVLARFTGLLVTMIGEPLTLRLMRQAWPDGFSDAGT
jgi:hypothetical protein